ncbi:hypothetical protein K9M48_02815 [Candidatus Gracilibacteria bacterium]|nr:hypothetical protein [Candidatus Gracilibacteria bacterium]
MRKLIIKRTLLTMITLGSIFSFGYSQNGFYQTQSEYLDIISTQLLASQTDSTKDILNSFCSVVLINSGLIIDDIYVYSPGESVFLYLICHNINKDLDFKFNQNFLSGDKSYLKKQDFNDLGIIDYGPNGDYDYCDPQKDMDNCDISSHFPSVFNVLINDIVSFQQSRLYGLQNPDFDEMKIEDQVDNYSKEKFNVLFCDTTNGLYPQLCKTMKSYLKSSAKLLKGLDIINYQNILVSDDKGLISCPATSASDYDFLKCGLIGHGFDIDSKYINLIYNEIFYYRLLLKFYEEKVLSAPTEIAPAPFNKDTTTAKNYFKNKIYEFNREINRMHSAVSNTTKMLNEIYATFPLHIGFLMYQEDLLILRDKYLYKIVTPFYTLYGKLRNVQEIE